MQSYNPKTRANDSALPIPAFSSERLMSPHDVQWNRALRTAPHDRNEHELRTSEQILRAKHPTAGYRQHSTQCHHHASYSTSQHPTKKPHAEGGSGDIDSDNAARTPEEEAPSTSTALREDIHSANTRL